MKEKKGKRKKTARKILVGNPILEDKNSAVGLNGKKTAQLPRMMLILLGPLLG